MKIGFGGGGGQVECGGVSSFANFFPQKTEHLYSILQLSVWNTPKERFPGLLQLRKIQELSDVFCAGTCTPFRLEPTTLSLWNLHPFPSGTSVHFTLESASFPSGICISFHPEPASLPSGICIPFRLESASLPSRAPSPCVPPPSPACVLHFLRRFSSRTDNAATKKKDLSLSLTGSKTALPVTQNLHPSLGFLFEDFAAAEFFWVDLRPFVSLARAACKVTKIRSYNNNLQDLQLLVSRVLIAQH